MISNALKLVAAWPEREPARRIARQYGGLCLEATSAETAHLPFAALAIVVSDSVEEILAAHPLGAWLVCERTFKGAPLSELNAQNAPRAVGLYPMVARPGLSNTAADAHWRDVHGPLALGIHEVMTHYYQLAIVHRFVGPEWNGIALCCGESEADLRHRFYNSADGERVIGEDVRKFADVRRSPRRVMARVLFGGEG